MTGDITIPPTAEEPGLPGQEKDLEPKPDWRPRYPGSGRLADRVAIVTGGDSGIGRAVAALFAREGADVAIVYLSEHEDAQRTQQIVEQEGRKAILLAGDLGDRSFSDKVVAETLSAFGRIDILVNNAGEQHPDDDITEITEHQLRRTFQTNIFSMFFLTQAVIPHLNPGSAIVNCTSVTMYKGSGGLLDYSATKGAITAFTRSLLENVIGKGIRVNAVHLGPYGRRSIRSAVSRKMKFQASAKVHPWEGPGSQTRSRRASSSSPVRILHTCRGKCFIQTAVWLSDHDQPAQC